MQWSQLTRWGSVLLMSGILSILAIIAGVYYHTTWSQSQAGQESSSGPALSRGEAEVECCDESGCKKCIPVLLTEDVFKLLPDFARSVNMDIPPHQHDKYAFRTCCDRVGCTVCYEVIFRSPELYKKLSLWLEQRNKDAKEKPAR
jgi:hypothetical protein